MTFSSFFFCFVWLASGKKWEKRKTQYLESKEREKQIALTKVDPDFRAKVLYGGDFNKIADVTNIHLSNGKVVGLRFVAIPKEGSKSNKIFVSGSPIIANKGAIEQYKLAVEKLGPEYKPFLNEFIQRSLSS